MKENIEILLNNMVLDNAFPGANYSLVSQDTNCMGSVGYKSLYPNKEENTINTKYDMASLTKVVVTNTIISRMLDKKMINLNDNVSKYLNRFKHKNIKILDIVTHSSGLPADYMPDINIDKDIYLNQLFDLDLEYETGSKVVYSDIGFIILGFLIEEIYGKSLDVVAKEEVFEPLGMVNSEFNPKDKDSCAPTEITKDRGIVKGIVHDEKSYVLGGVAGHAGLFSTIEDINKFVEMILNDGYINNKQYLSKDIIDLWFYPIKNVDETTYRSMGWIVGSKPRATGEYGDMNTIFHLGFTGSSIVINREKKIGAILISNRVYPTRDNVKIWNCRPEFYKCCVDEYEQIKTKKM